MPYPAHVSDAAYCYDGSYAGFLCCIFESYTRREIPSAVLGPAEGQITLFGTEAIATDPTHARRVANGLTRLGPMVRERVMTGFLSTEEEKDLILLRFARRCFDEGPRAVQMLGDPDVHAAFVLERNVNNALRKRMACSVRSSTQKTTYCRCCAGIFAAACRMRTF